MKSIRAFWPSWIRWPRRESATAFAKRENIATSGRAERSRPYVVAAAAAWRELSAGAENKELANYAHQQLERMKIASSLIEHNAEISASTSHHPTNKVLFQSLIEIEKAAMRQMSRPEFEAYQRRIETVLSGVEANIEPGERHDYDEIATAARDVVNIRREYLEPSEGEVTTPAAARPEADNEAWGRAIARHGEQVVQRGNDAMIEVEMAGEAIDRAAHDGGTPATPRLNFVLSLSLSWRHGWPSPATAGSGKSRRGTKSSTRLSRRWRERTRLSNAIKPLMRVNETAMGWRTVPARRALTVGSCPIRTSH